jgi:hypothetical protein
MANADVTLLPDAGPLITLAYADALDLLLMPGWSVALVDMVLHEVTRNSTPTSEQIAGWVRQHGVPVLGTRVYRHHTQTGTVAAPARKSNLGELAVQEAMNEFALTPVRTGVFLFEDHRIARSSFLLPSNCRKVSTRAFLIFLEQQKLIESASAIERRAIHAGRHFSKLRFPPE